MIVYFIIYFVLMVMAIYFFARKEKWTLIVMTVFLILFAGLRGDTVDHDYLTYKEYYTSAQGAKGVIVGFAEPSFVILSKALPDLRLVMLVYALIAISITVFALRKLTPYVFFSIALWWTHYFLVQEMNQVRAGAAIGILLLAIPEILDRRFIRFFLLILLASCFHYSALMFLPCYFMNTGRVQRVYFFLVPLGYVMFLLGLGLVDVLAKLNIGMLNAKMEVYNSLYEMGQYTKLNVFNPIELMRVGIAYLLLFNWKLLASKNPFFVVLLKIYILSIFLLLAFATLPAFALRLADLFGIVEIVLVPLLFYVFDTKYPVLLAVFIYGLLFISVDLLYNHFLNAYTI